MVYFGSRHFRNTNRGWSQRDKARVLVLAIVMIGTGGLLVYLQFVQKTATPPGSVVGLDSTDDVPPTSDDNVIEVASPELPPVTAFTADPELLDRVEDAEIPWNNAHNLVALDYLFHRWRAEEWVPLQEEVPEWRQLPEQAATIRGSRYFLNLELADTPILRTGPMPNGGRSGVEQYWELWATSGPHLYCILVLDKVGNFPAGTLLDLEADFFRMHGYETQGAELKSVPMWVGHVIRHDDVILAKRSWTPVYWVLALSFGGLAVLFALLWFQGALFQPPPRPRRRTLAAARD